MFPAEKDPGSITLDDQVFRLFEFERLLNEDPYSKCISLLGKINGKPAILTLEKTAFGNGLPSATNEAEYPSLKLIQRNDIYRWYLASISEGKYSVKATIIYPATDVHIRKYEKQGRRMVRETPDIYNEHIEKYIQTMKGSRLQWLYNVLEHKAETERIIFEDPDPETGFMLLPDLKWDEKTLSSLYLCAIFNRRDLSSIRDLNQTHIPFLQKIQRSVIQATTAAWPEVSADQLRIYFHYHPSYYHLHFHIVHTDFQGGDGMAVGRAWLLDDVIEQLTLLGPEGFKRKTITVIVGEESDLWKQVYSKLPQS